MQTLQILQFHSIQDCGREYPRISTSSACYNRALCRSGFLLIAHLIVIIPNSLKITVVFSLQLLRNMLSNSVCSECYCCQTFTQQEQNIAYLIVIISLKITVYLDTITEEHVE